MNYFVNQFQGSFNNTNSGAINYRNLMPLDYFFNNSILETFQNRIILKQLFQLNNNKNNINNYILTLVNTNIESKKMNNIFSRYALLQLPSDKSNEKSNEIIKVTELPYTLHLKSSLYNNQSKIYRYRYPYRLLSIIVNLGNYHYVCFTRKDDNTFYLINDNEEILNYDINNINKFIQQKGHTAEMLCYELVD